MCKCEGDNLCVSEWMCISACEWKLAEKPIYQHAETN